MAMQNLIFESFLREFEGTFFQKSSLIASPASPTNRNLFTYIFYYIPFFTLFSKLFIHAKSNFEEEKIFFVQNVEFCFFMKKT